MTAAVSRQGRRRRETTSGSAAWRSGPASSAGSLPSRAFPGPERRCNSRFGGRMVRVLICDDQYVVCDGLRAILSTAPAIEVVGLAHDGAEAVDLTASAHPDVVLMDLKMPIVNGVEATREICARFPDVRVLVLTTYDADQWIFDAIRAGASGYLLKDSPREALVAAVHGTAAGRTDVDPSVAGRLFAHVTNGMPMPESPLLDALTDR